MVRNIMGHGARQRVFAQKNEEFRRRNKMKLVNKIPVLLALALTVNGMAFIHPASVRAAKTVSLSTKKLAAKAGQSEDPKLKRNNTSLK